MQSMCERGGLIAKDDYAALSQSPVAAASALAPAWVTSNHYAAPPRTLTTERATREERAKAATQPHPASCSPDILGGDRVHWSQAPKIWVCMAGTFLALRWCKCHERAFDFWRRDVKKWARAVLIAGCLGRELPLRRHKAPAGTAQIKGRITMQMK